MDLQKIGYEVVYWSYVAQDRDQCRAAVTTVMKLMSIKHKAQIVKSAL
jgi:hypothetical protein